MNEKLMIEKLDNPNLLKVFSFLSEDKDLVNASAVCLLWHTIVRDESIWSKKIKSAYQKENQESYQIYATNIDARVSTYYAVSKPIWVAPKSEASPKGYELKPSELVKQFNPVYLFNNFDDAQTYADANAKNEVENGGPVWAGIYKYSPIFTIKVKDNCKLYKTDIEVRLNTTFPPDYKYLEGFNGTKKAVTKCYAVFYKAGFFRKPETYNLQIPADPVEKEKKESRNWDCLPSFRGCQII